MEDMYGEVGCSTVKMDMWLLCNELDMCPEYLYPLETR